MFFPSKNGIIALDIDGTVSHHLHELEKNVIDFFELIEKNWHFIFITGRSFQWGYQTLKALPFSYHLAVQNGALLIHLPSKTILKKNYLSKKFFPEIDKISQKYHTDFVIYAGLENHDQCYFRSHLYSSDQLNYLEKRSKALKEEWHSVHNFESLPFIHFPSLKFFAKKDKAFLISQELEALGLQAPPNRDPFDQNHFVIQATDSQANKGGILKTFNQLLSNTGPVIAAGDDHNDRTMLQQADYKIVMQNAPSEILSLATIIAPPASQSGIITGLKQAIQLSNRT